MNRKPPRQKRLGGFSFSFERSFYLGLTVKLAVALSFSTKQYNKNIIVAEIDAEFKAMLNAVSSDTVDTFDEQRVKELMDEKSKLQQQLAQIAERKQKRENTKSRLDEIFTILDGIKNRPMEYDDRLVRQIIECVVVESKERIKVVFVGGLEITETLCEKKTQVSTEQQDETHSSSNPYKNDEKYLFYRPFTNKNTP